MADPVQFSQLRDFFPWERIAVDFNTMSTVKQVVIPAAISLIVGWAIWHVVYYRFFHPLAKFPGPWLASFTEMWALHRNWDGRSPFHFAAVHRKYGPIVRIAPNQLSVSDVNAWKDIYGHHTRDKTFLKGLMYNSDTKNYGLRHIVSERDPAKHAEMRRMLSHAFSTKALLEQEDIIQHYIDLLIKRLGQRYAGKERGPDGELCNIVDWFNYTTFDIIGDLAFGESNAFSCLETQKAHPWVTTILDAIFVGSLSALFRKIPIPGMRKLGFLLVPKGLKEKGKLTAAYARDLVSKRLASKTDRKDFWYYILDREESKDISPEELTMQAQVLIVAGSETTATVLSGLTFYLLKTPRVYNILKDEVRSTFSHYSDITSQSTLRMQYLNAVIEEGLRLFPPVPVGLVRISPGATVAGNYIPRGTDISVHSYAMGHNPAYWSNPGEFNPERWIDPGNTDTKEASQPFSLGPRGCLGKNLAYMELRVIVAKLVYAYDFELMDQSLDWEQKCRTWGLWWKPALNVKVTKRPGLEWTADDIPL